MGRKHCEKRINCWLRAIYPFPTVFSKGLFPRGVKRCYCVGMGQNILKKEKKSGNQHFILFQQYFLSFTNLLIKRELSVLIILKKKALENTVRKGENVFDQHFLLL